MPRDLRIERHRDRVVDHLAKAGRALELHQVERTGPLRGNVSPWASREVEDFHSTLMAIWIWARHQALSGERRFEDNRQLAWRFVLEAGVRFLPDEIAPGDYEAPFDVACLLHAALADAQAGSEPSRQAMAELAADALRRYVTRLGASQGREFQDPGFLLFSLATYGQQAGEGRAVRAAVNYCDHFFGIETPPPPAEEKPHEGALFDFVSSTATRVLAVLATQGDTPFGALWLRERVLPILPTGFVARPLDENGWNGTVAWLFAEGYRLTRDAEWYDRYERVLDELQTRDADGDGALGRDLGFPENEVLPTFVWAFAVDALKE